jgi:hypothetical protein
MTVVHTLGSLIAATLIAATAFAAAPVEQRSNAAPVGDLSAIPLEDRLIQEHLARRAELVKLRQAARDEIAKAKNEGEKKAILRKLEQDEKPLREALGKAARARSDAEKARKEKLDSARPRG